MRQGEVDARERWRSGLRFGDLQPTALGTILTAYERGQMRDWADLCEYMVRTDPHLSSVYETRKTRAARTKWVVEPGVSRDPALKAIAEPAARFAAEALEGVVDLARGFEDMLDAIGVGFSAHEIDWRRQGREWIPHDFIWRHQNRFRWDEEYGLRLYDSGSRGSSDGYGEELTPDLWVVHVPKEHAGYPTRQGIHQSAVWTWLFKTWARKFRIGAVERFGSPFVWAEVVKNTTEETRTAIKANLENLTFDGVAVIEEGGKVNFEALAGAMGNGQIYRDYLADADSDLTKNYLGASDAVEPGENGARAAVESRTDSNLDPRTEKDVMSLAQTIERDVFRPLLRFNPHLFGGKLPPTPKLMFTGETTSNDLPAEIINAGVITVNELRQSVGLDPVKGQDGERMINAEAANPLRIGVIDRGVVKVDEVREAEGLPPVGPQEGGNQFVTAPGGEPSDPAVEASAPLPPGGAGADVPFASKQTASQSSPMSSRSMSPLERALRAESGAPARRSPKQLSLRWNR